MRIVVPKESTSSEQRVALTPEVVKKLMVLGHQVAIEKGAGVGAHILDDTFQEAGADIIKDTKALYKNANIVVRVSPPTVDEVAELPVGAVVLGLFRPYDTAVLAKPLSTKKVTALAMELIPRISRAQSMDVLSSQSNLAGYRAVIEAAAEYGRSFPLMMTAAGTVAPARVLVLGAGVAGLQAIATAKRLGAIVSAFDVRPAVKEQVESLGATFVEVSSTEVGEGTGGYAKEMSNDYKRQQAELLAQVITTQDIVITTAQIPGKQAPRLITAEMVKSMKQGSVIVDLAIETGGNCELTESDKIISKHGVKIVGYSNMSSRIAFNASQVYAQNVFNLLKLLLPGDDKKIHLEDEIIRATLLTHDGEVINPLYQTSSHTAVREVAGRAKPKRKEKS